MLDFVERKERSRSGKCANSVREGKSPLQAGTEKLNWLVKENAQQLRIDHPRLKQKRTVKTGNKDMQSRTRISEIGALSREPMGRSGSRRKDQFIWTLGYEKPNLSRKPRTNCQELEELRSICCEETDRARQLRFDELFLQQERNPSTVSVSS